MGILAFPLAVTKVLRHIDHGKGYMARIKKGITISIYLLLLLFKWKQISSLK